MAFISSVRQFAPHTMLGSGLASYLAWRLRNCSSTFQHGVIVRDPTKWILTLGIYGCGSQG